MRQSIEVCILMLTVVTDGQTKYLDLETSQSDEQEPGIAQQFISEDKFFYFAYGSNLFEPRLHINNPSAEFYSKAKLKGYRLDFNMTLGAWNGAVATIAKDPGRHVWGALWVMDKQDIVSLDRQEGVDKGWYYPLEVVVRTPDGKTVIARTYKEFVDPPPKHPSQIEPQRRPSNTYHQVILIGAVNCKLPSAYVEWLYKFKTNGHHAEPHMVKQLGYPFYLSQEDI